nr:MAG TPA: hypothetical protein [Caudoviricetes sp.]DAP73320.1 MAG TPA: hypothetical protein [Caudoviricetes sp.]
MCGSFSSPTMISSIMSGFVTIINPPNSSNKAAGRKLARSAAAARPFPPAAA